jgi:hypothetical protein
MNATATRPVRQRKPLVAVNVTAYFAAGQPART